MMIGQFADGTTSDTSEESKKASEQKLEELGGEGAFFSKDSK